MKKIYKIIIALALCIISIFACACTEGFNLNGCVKKDPNLPNTNNPIQEEMLETEYSVEFTSYELDFYQIVAKGYVVAEDVPESISLMLDGEENKIEMKTIKGVSNGYKIGFDQIVNTQTSYLTKDSVYTAKIYLHYSNQTVQPNKYAELIVNDDYERQLIISMADQRSFTVWDKVSNWTSNH